MRRGSSTAALTTAILLTLAACRQDAGPAPSPPTIEAVGVATDVRFYQDHMRLVFADGSVHEVPTSYRQVAEAPGNWLVIIGSDSTGPFVASFPTQAGLPADCFRNNSTGIERGDYLETDGVLWAKAATYTSATTPEIGSPYPGGTRFCFNSLGLVTAAIGPEVADPVSFDAWALATDRKSVTVTFIGGRVFHPNDPCSISYRGTAVIDGDELVMGIYPEPFPGEVPDELVCDAAGYERSLTLELSDAFEGNQVRDVAGQMWFLERPADLVEITGLPDAWVLRSEKSLPESPTGRWARIYAPPDSPLDVGSSRGLVQLFQAFGAPAGVTGGEPQPDVRVNGEEAASYFWEPSGEMVLVWKIGEDGVALAGNRSDFTEDDFVALAESVVPAP